MITLARALALTAALSLAAACTPAAEAPAGPAPIRIDGSSTVFPLTQAVVQAIGDRAGAPIEVKEAGTTAGFQRFCNGEIDIAAASRPILTREVIACFRNGVSYVEAPVGFDGLTIVVNPANPLTSIGIDDLSVMWAPEAQGQVMAWRDVNSRWPETPLHLFGPGAESGTFDYFTEAVIGETGSSRTDYTASEDDNVIVEGVAADAGALGYVGHAYYERNRERLKALAVDAGAGAVDPTAENIASGQYTPLSRPIFIYVSAAALARPEVAAFARAYLTEAPALVAQVGYVPLPAEAYSAYLHRIEERRVGTAFSGQPAAGLTIEQVIAAPLIEPSS